MVNFFVLCGIKHFFDKLLGKLFFKRLFVIKERRFLMDTYVGPFRENAYFKTLLKDVFYKKLIWDPFFFEIGENAFWWTFKKKKMLLDVKFKETLLKMDTNKSV